MEKPIQDLLARMARRAKELVDLPMPVLRKAAEADPVTCRTRGELIEWALSEEFENEASRLDSRIHNVEDLLEAWEGPNK